MALIIVVLLLTVFCLWQYVAELKWWRDYYSRRYDSERALNRKLIDRVCSVPSSLPFTTSTLDRDDDSPTEWEWDDDTLDA